MMIYAKNLYLFYCTVTILEVAKFEFSLDNQLAVALVLNSIFVNHSTNSCLQKSDEKY